MNNKFNNKKVALGISVLILTVVVIISLPSNEEGTDPNAHKNTVVDNDIANVNKEGSVAKAVLKNQPNQSLADESLNEHQRRMKILPMLQRRSKKLTTKITGVAPT